MPTDAGGCPDEAACHFNCLTGCWRVANDTPLPSSGRHEWPPSVVEQYGDVTTSPLPVAADTSPDPRPSGALPSPSTPAVSGVQTAGSGDASPAEERGGPTPIGALVEQLAETVSTTRARRRRKRAVDVEDEPTPVAIAENAGVPIVDLTALVLNLHDTRLDLRERAKLLRQAAAQIGELHAVVLSVSLHLEQTAEQVEELRRVLHGGP